MQYVLEAQRSGHNVNDAPDLFVSTGLIYMISRRGKTTVHEKDGAGRI